MLKAVPEDFVVEEIPAYQPCGSGEHLFVWIEKRDVSAEQLQRHVAKTLGITTRDIGVAGLKDRRAITRQYISVPATHADHIDRLQTDSIRVLSATRHGNKLKTGHLQGNRFEILLRGASLTGGVEAALQGIRRRGFANRFGTQRFGSAGETEALGFELLTGKRSLHSLHATRRRFLGRLALSAAQSRLFNAVVERREQGGSLFSVIAGDLFQVIASGGLFADSDATVQQARYDNGEIAPTGPLFGPKMRQPTGEAAAIESAVLADRDLTPAVFTRYRKLTPGARRVLVERAVDLHWTQEPEGMRLRFQLRPGVYATTLIETAFPDIDEDLP